jgi:hypothetical protein
MLAALLAAAAYIPLFLTRPGQVAADTKQYLYLDPGRLTASAASMWDPNTGLGTVTHQNIGYLFPMGPYYSLISWLGIPVWIGQRIWMGTLMVAAGLGVAYCARHLGLEGPGRVLAAAAYMLTPYTIDYLDRISAILMPWAALGWMVGLVAAAARTGRWRYPAAFAFVVALVGGVNATSILLVLLAPAVWLVHAVWVSREITLRRAAAAAGRIGVLSFLVSLWWAAGLWAEGNYGINILRVTETVPTVSHTSSASEVLRGLGYWYFYGWDKVQPWTLPAGPYTQSAWLLGLSLTLPVLSVVLGMVTRWRYRSFSLALVGLGTLIAVGAYPFSHPSLFGALIKGASSGSTLALAMRSVDRVVPLVVLGLALLMGSGVTAISMRWSAAGTVTGLACLGLVAANLPALWTGAIIASNLSRPSTIPSYWTQAAAYLNSQGSSSRVLGLPGEDFAAYSWGVTQDPIAPGLLNRPYVARQVVPSGTPAGANLLQALDEPLQEGTLDMSALAPVARLMSAGQILLQSDLQYERYHLPLPQVLWQSMVPVPAGISAPRAFGSPNPAPVIRYPLNSEGRLGIPTGTPQPPALAVFSVGSPRPLVRAEAATQPIVIAGDGRGIVEAAGAGLLDSHSTILYAASLSQDPGELRQALAADAQLVLTDTNPLAQYRWGSVRDNVGQVQQPGVADLSTSPSDYALPIFPGQTTADQTVAEVSGIASVTASGYGDSLSFTPEDKPINAVDGDPSTAWTFGARSPVAGTRIQINLTGPVTADHITLTQAQVIRTKRRITSVTLLFDGKNPVHVALTPASVGSTGQTVTFPARTFSDLEVVVDGATGGADKRYDGLPQVGFSEIAVPGVNSAGETLRLPTDLLAAAGSSSLQHPLAILLQRSRAIEPPRHDPEPTMSRTFVLPTARTFSVSGTAEINAGDSDYLINQLIGLTPNGPVPGPIASDRGSTTVVAANSSTRLDGDRNARANQAADGNPATAWTAETGPQSGEWLSLTLSGSTTFDHIDLQVVNDGRHSLPSRITITTDRGSRTVDVPVPPVGTGRQQGATTAIPVNFAALAGRSVRVTIDAVKQVRSLDYYSTFTGTTDILPVGIAELGVPGVTQPAPPPTVPTSCTGDLLRIDGQPVDVQISGSTSAALNGSQIALSACGNSSRGLVLGPGPHSVVTSPRLPTGWSIDQLWFDSAAGGGAGAAIGPNSGAGTQLSRPPSPPSSVPTVHLDQQTRTSWTATVEGNGQPFWLVLGQSFSAGWSATLAGGTSLGAPKLVDAYANGWYVPAGEIKGTTVIHLTWTPQRVVWAAIGISAVAVLASALMAVWPERWVSARRRRKVPGRRAGPYPPAGFSPAPASWRAWVAEAGAPWPMRAGITTVVVWAGLAGAVSRPAIGVAAGAAALVGWRWSRGRLAVRILAVGVLLTVPVYDVQQQIVHRYLPAIDWPSELSSANDITWLGLSLLGADLVAGLLRSRKATAV